MIDPEKHCEILDINIRDKIATIYSAFKLFVQLYSAIVGGAFAIHLQQSAASVPSNFLALSNLLVGLVGITCGIMILDAQFSWRRFRVKLSQVGGLDESGKPAIPPPGSFFQTAWTVICMLVVIVVATFGFWTFNPFRP